MKDIPNKHRFAVKCPYCGFLNELVIPADGQVFRSMTCPCDVEAGGCDKEFVIRTKVQVHVTALKIEGEENEADRQDADSCDDQVHEE